MSPNLVDKLVNYFDPKSGLSRQKARFIQYQLDKIKSRHYEGGSSGRRTEGWNPRSTNADTEVKLAHRALRDRTRYLCRNDAFAARAKQVIVNSTIGSGIRLQIRGPERIKKKVEFYWKKWAESTAMDYAGRHNWYGLQKIAMETFVESGEALARIYKRPMRDDQSPVQFRVIEPDYIDSNKEMRLACGYIIQGIEFDLNDRRTHYWCFEQHPGSFLLFQPRSFISNPIPAEEILHIYDMTRAELCRGVTVFHPVITLLKDFSDFSDATLMRQKIASCFAAFIHDMEAPGDIGSTKDDDELTNLESGMIARLPAGKSISFSQPPDSGDYPAYAGMLLRQIASGLGITYESLTSDYSQSNFSSSRMAEIQFRKNVNRWQDIMINQFCQPTWNEFMKIMRVLVGPEVEQLEVGFTTPAHLYIDPQKEAAATIQSIRAGLTSWSEAVREQGFSPEELLDEIKRDFDELKKRGLKLECDPSVELEAEQKMVDAEEDSPEKKETKKKGKVA